MAAEEEFEKLIEETSERAAAIECSPDEYREGLRGLIGQCRIDIQASEETDPP